MGTYTPSATFHSTLTVVDDGQGVNASITNVGPKQLADNCAYFQANLSPYISGGTQTLPNAADLNLNSAGGGIIRINSVSLAETGLVLNAGLFVVANASDSFLSGDLHVAGDVTLGDTSTNTVIEGATFTCTASTNVFRTRIYAPKAIIQGGWNGTYTYSSESTDHVFALNATLSGTTIWKISNTPTANDVMRFSNMDTTACSVQRPDGTTLSSLQNLSGNVFAITVGFTGGQWKIIDYSLRP